MNYSFTKPRGSLGKQSRFSRKSHTLKLIMRISYINIFLLIGSLQMLVATPAYVNGQTIEKTTVKMELQDAALKRVFQEIEKQTEFRFLAAAERVNRYSGIDLPAGTYTVKDVLEHVLEGTTLKYEQRQNYILVFFPEENIREMLKASEPRVAGLVKEAVAIAGTVRDARTQEPLPGVNVLVKGTTIGTVTDVEGNYSLAVPELTGALVFSYIGYASIEEPVNGRTSIDIVMVVDERKLDEIVVIGYGTSSKTKLINSASTLKTDKIEKIPYKTVAETLAGRVPGVFMQHDNGDGALPKISIRGGGEPLYFIDGIKQTKEMFSMIPAGDIETISILKDASAGSVYGAEAGDGIVLVTTKKGGGTGIHVNYSSNISFQSRGLKPNFLSPYEFALMANEAAFMDGRVPTYSDEMVSIFRNNTDPRYKATDTYDETVRKLRPLSNHYLSFGGRSGNTSAFLSLNYQTEGSEFKVSENQGTDRFSIRSDVSHEIEDIGLTISGHIDAQKYDAIFPPNGSMNIWTNIRTYGMSPGPLVNPAGNFFQPYFIDPPLPEASDKAGYDRRKENWINTRLSFKWELPWVKGLDISAFGNYRVNNSNGKRWSSTSTGRAQLYTWENEPIAVGKPTLTQSMEEETKLDLETQINYSRTFLDDHTVSLTGVYTQYQIDYNILSANRRDFLSPAVDQMFAGSTANWQNGGFAAEEARRGWIGRAKYDYKSKYIFEFSFRYDGSDNFPEDKRWGFFPAVSAGWNLAHESFFEGVSDKLRMNTLKVRGSWGITGLTSGGGRFGYIPGYNYVNDNYYPGAGGWVPGFTEGPLVSSQFTWYERTSYDLGLDFAFIDDRLSGSIDWFFYRTMNYLGAPEVQYTTPLGKPLPQIITNSAHRRAGAEFLLTYRTRIQNVDISIGGNLAYFDQLWEKRFDETEAVLGNPYKRLTNEKDYYSVGYVSDGYYQSMDEVLDNPRLMGREINWPGNVKYKDLNGDGKVDIDDQRKIGTSNFPHLTYGTTIDLSWKGFSLNALVQGTSNRQLYLGSTWYGAIHNKPYDIQADAWTEDNRGAMFPRNSYVVAEFGTTSDFYLMDAWYVRLKALSLSYNLKNILLTKVNGINEMSVILSGTNLSTISPTLDYYMDPEVEATAGHNMRQPPKMFNLGIRLGL